MSAATSCTWSSPRTKSAVGWRPTSRTAASSAAKLSTNSPWCSWRRPTSPPSPCTPSSALRATRSSRTSTEKISWSPSARTRRPASSARLSSARAAGNGPSRSPSAEPPTSHHHGTPTTGASRNSGVEEGTVTARLDRQLDYVSQS